MPNADFCEGNAISLHLLHCLAFDRPYYISNTGRRRCIMSRSNNMQRFYTPSNKREGEEAETIPSPPCPVVTGPPITMTPPYIGRGSNDLNAGPRVVPDVE